eukprot:m.719601 g.719601  ORF g.719601 m.719601 type:complete len:87 (-) comp23001_c0_seq17:1664-1924(-)
MLSTTLSRYSPFRGFEAKPCFVTMTNRKQNQEYIKELLTLNIRTTPVEHTRVGLCLVQQSQQFVLQAGNCKSTVKPYLGQVAVIRP